MDNKLISPIIMVNTDIENSSVPNIYLQDGTAAAITESNITAIMHGFENGSISNVKVPQAQLETEGYEFPIQMLDSIENIDDFKQNEYIRKLLNYNSIPLMTVAEVTDKVPIDFANIQYQVYNRQNDNYSIESFNALKITNPPQKGEQCILKEAKSFQVKERFNAAKAAERIISIIPFIQYNNAVYLYTGTYYQLCESLKLYKLIRKTLIEETTCNGMHRYIKDIAKFIQTDSKSVDLINANIENKVMFSNCVFNLDTLRAEQHSPYYYNTHALSVPFVFSQNLAAPVFSKYVFELADGNKVLIRRIWEALGLLLSNDIKAKKIVVLVGKGNTGKSVFGNVVRELIADSNVTSFAPQKLTERFIGTSLVNSAVNICMDLPSVPIDPTTAAILKNLSGGDIVSGEIKYMNNFSYVYQGHLLFGSNYPIKLNYKDQAFAERLLIIPCENPIPRLLQDPNLLEKIKPELPAIAKYAVMCFASVRKNHYTFSGDDVYSVNDDDIYVKAQLKTEFENNSDYSVECFASQMCELASNDKFVEITELFVEYQKFCIDNNIDDIKKSNTFSKKLNNIFPSIKNDKKRVKGQSVNVWYGIALKK